jgi:transcriptional regulator with XRE-family HTH domain
MENSKPLFVPLDETRFREALKNRGLRSAAVARTAGVTSGAISGWYRGGKIRAIFAKVIEEELGISPEEYAPLPDPVEAAVEKAIELIPKNTDYVMVCVPAQIWEAFMKLIEMTGGKIS